MVIAAWLVLLAMLSWFFSSYLDRQYNPNEKVQTSTNVGYNEVVLDRNRYGHYVASGRINGEPVTFMLDTGATIVSVPENMAARLALQKGPAMQVMTANGTVPVYATILDEVQLGGITLTGVRASINPHMEQDEILLGMSFLKQLDFSQQGDQLKLRQPETIR